MVSLIKVSKRNKAGTLSFTIPLEIMNKIQILRGASFKASANGENIIYDPAEEGEKNTVKASPRNKKGTLSFTIPKSIVKSTGITQEDQFLVYLEEKSIRFSRV